MKKSLLGGGPFIMEHHPPPKGPHPTFPKSPKKVVLSAGPKPTDGDGADQIADLIVLLPCIIYISYQCV